MYANLSDYQADLEKCTHCGYCQATCPVFREELLECYVPRARLNLIRACLVDKDIPVSPKARDILTHCLLCTNCSQTCSAQLPVDEIITAARVELYRQAGGVANMKTAVIHKLFNQRGVAGLLGKVGVLAQKINLGPQDTPALASRFFDRHYRGTIPAVGQRRGRVAYFVGCGTQFFYPETGEAAVLILTRNGFEVVIPDNLACCGVPALADGNLAAAQEAARKNLRALGAVGEVDAVVTDCTSCGLVLKKKLSQFFAADDPLQPTIAAVAGKVYEATEFMLQAGLAEPPGAVHTSYTYHVPCHRGWSPGVADAPRGLLAQVPGLERLEMAEPQACCGAAGTFYLDHRELSDSIRAKKMADIADTGAEYVITQCPMCRFYLSQLLPPGRVVHPLTLLARGYAAHQPD